MFPVLEAGTDGGVWVGLAAAPPTISNDGLGETGAGRGRSGHRQGLPAEDEWPAERQPRGNRQVGSRHQQSSPDGGAGAFDSARGRIKGAATVSAAGTAASGVRGSDGTISTGFAAGGLAAAPAPAVETPRSASLLIEPGVAKPKGDRSTGDAADDGLARAASAEATLSMSSEGRGAIGGECNNPGNRSLVTFAES